MITIMLLRFFTRTSLNAVGLLLVWTHKYTPHTSRPPSAISGRTFQKPSELWHVTHSLVILICGDEYNV